MFARLKVLDYIAIKYLAIRQNGLVALLYGAIALALLSPLAATATLPDQAELLRNVAITVEARSALEAGQFPLRVLPSIDKGFGYPLFQFYGQLVYTLTGCLFRYLTPDNPYAACLLVLWLALAASGFFTYLTSYRLSRSIPAAILAGASYMAAPYFLVNIFARGAYSEAIAQGLVPIAIYLLLRCYWGGGWVSIVLCGLGWAGLALTHVITFVYTSLFGALFIGFLAIAHKAGWTRQNWWGMMRAALAYSLSWLLSLYFLAPIILEKNLRIRDLLLSPAGSTWITPLPTLLQPTSLPPEPQPGVGLITPNAHMAVGWVLLAAWATVFYYSYFSARLPAHLRTSRAFTTPLLVLFAIAFILVWSPIDFWQWLPPAFWVVQFTYRLLTQVMWTGALLCAYALILLFRSRLSGAHVVVGLLLIGMSASSYLPVLRSSSFMPSDLVKHPDSIGILADYLYKQEVLPTWQEMPIPLIDPQSRRLVLNTEWTTLPKSKTYPAKIHLVGTVSQKPVPQGKLSLLVWINDQIITAKPLPSGSVDEMIDLPSLLEPSLRLKFAIRSTKLSKTPSDDAIAPNQPKNLNLKNDQTLKINQNLIVDRLRLVLLPSFEYKPIGRSRKRFHLQGSAIVGEVNVRSTWQILQLPALYYPDLLNVQLDQKQVPYLAIPYKRYALVALEVPQGLHKISVEFRGLVWANWISLMTWLAIGVLICFACLSQPLTAITTATKASGIFSTKAKF